MMRFAAEAAKAFPRAEIVELHNEAKLDAPSGTAKATAARMGTEPDDPLRPPAGARRAPGGDLRRRGGDARRSGTTRPRARRSSRACCSRSSGCATCRPGSPSGSTRCCDSAPQTYAGSGNRPGTNLQCVETSRGGRRDTQVDLRGEHPMRFTRALSVAVGTAVGASVFVALAAAGGAANANANYDAVCPGALAGTARCLSNVVTDAHGNPAASTSPTGLSPPRRSSRSTASPRVPTAGAGQTIAIVDAYDDPTAESDLAVFSSQYGLPACTTANGCFTKVNQTGGTSYPRANAGWALEISLDVQWAHAIAPGAQDPARRGELQQLRQPARRRGLREVACPVRLEQLGSLGVQRRGVVRLALRPARASASSSPPETPGLPAEYPSASPNVISVGGTTLHFAGGELHGGDRLERLGRGLQPVRERDLGAVELLRSTARSDCAGKRATPDVSLDADPASGVSVYDIDALSGPAGLVHRGRHERLRTDVGGALRGRGHDRERRIRVRQQHHLPGHHVREQRRQRAGRPRSGHRPRQLDRLARSSSGDQGRPSGRPWSLCPHTLRLA